MRSMAWVSVAMVLVACKSSGDTDTAVDTDGTDTDDTDVTALPDTDDTDDVATSQCEYEPLEFDTAIEIPHDDFRVDLPELEGCCWYLYSSGGIDGLSDKPWVEGCTVDASQDPPFGNCLDNVGCGWNETAQQYRCGAHYYNYQCLAEEPS